MKSTIFVRDTGNIYIQYMMHRWINAMLWFSVILYEITYMFQLLAIYLGIIKSLLYGL